MVLWAGRSMNHMCCCDCRAVAHTTSQRAWPGCCGMQSMPDLARIEAAPSYDSLRLRELADACA